MRLSKRLAVGVLAAVMALSMMTACGGGNPNEKPSSSESNASSNSSSSASSGSNSSSSSATGDNTGESSDKETPIVGLSRTEKYFNRYGVGIGEAYYYELEELNASKTYVTRTSDGVRVGLKVVDPGYDNADLVIYDKSKKEEYHVYGNWKEAYGWGDTKVVNCRTPDGDREIEAKENPLIPQGTQIKATTYKVNGIEYYAEKTMLGDGYGYSEAYYYCFDFDDNEGMNLKYIVNEELCNLNTGETRQRIFRFNKISGKANMDMLRVPEGYKYYYDYSDTGRLTPKDNYPN